MDGIIPKYGWICPKCGRVYAPAVLKCMVCGMPEAPKEEVTPIWRKLLTENQAGRGA